LTDLIDLIGRPYRLGADGTEEDGAIDCIHLVYIALDRLGIETPQFKEVWYGQTVRQFGRDLLRWGDRVDRPQYDGDVLLLSEGSPVFAVFWNKGCLYISLHLNAVTWSPIGRESFSHCFRTKSV